MNFSEDKGEKAGSRVDGPTEGLQLRVPDSQGHMETGMCSQLPRGKQGEIVENCLNGFKISWLQGWTLRTRFSCFPLRVTYSLVRYWTHVFKGLTAECRHLSINYGTQHDPKQVREMEPRFIQTQKSANFIWGMKVFNYEYCFPKLFFKLHAKISTLFLSSGHK